MSNVQWCSDCRGFGTVELEDFKAEMCPTCGGNGKSQSEAS